MMGFPWPGARLRTTPGLVLQLDGAGGWLARHSVSTTAVPGLRLDHLRALQALTGGGDAAALAAALAADGGPLLDEDTLDEVIDDALGHGLLGVEGHAHGVAGGFALASAQLPMVADAVRVAAYGAAITAHAPGLRVAELGCGTGILSATAARAGAASVWACDEADVIEIARALIAENGLADKVELVQGRSFAIAPPAPVDLLIHELFGTDPLEESVLDTIRDVRDRWLAPGGRLLPRGFTVWAAAYGGAGFDAVQPLPARLTAALAPLGLRPGPLLAAADRPARRPEGGLKPPPPAARRGAPVALLEVDLHAEAPLPAGPRRHLLRLDGDGPVEAILVWFEIALDEERRLSTGPAGLPTHWGWQVHDLPAVIDGHDGDLLELEVEVCTEDGLEAVRLRALRPAALRPV